MKVLATNAPFDYSIRFFAMHAMQRKGWDRDGKGVTLT
jgi:hypothetical protein